MDSYAEQMGLPDLVHIGIVVKDLDKATKLFSRLLGTYEMSTFCITK